MAGGACRPMRGSGPEGYGWGIDRRPGRAENNLRKHAMKKGRCNMGITGISQADSLAYMAVANASSRTGTGIAMAGLKQTLDQEKQEGQALVAMINNSNSAGPLSTGGLGQSVNVSA